MLNAPLGLSLGATVGGLLSKSGGTCLDIVFITAVITGDLSGDPQTVAEAFLQALRLYEMP